MSVATRVGLVALPIFKAERHAAVPMVFLRTLANMACSRGRGSSYPGMVEIPLPELLGSRKQKGRRVKRQHQLSTKPGVAESSNSGVSPLFRIDVAKRHIRPKEKY